mmetsp:Transcript_13944/g.16823  ORF Transcript_13944/g.16823 Transcript_13944/m.16823 type:complete len:540 (-) Transcript_13944:446-2065(-)|eukprot:CAMPEP_0197853620 /NCGR_PEP_ID=MMETSP1438-20131217/23072_1 /TAXON_ID=1461541 /ORGANISM="Pterosperma sp., Strain CCMP1384" /LENGTH=539 /DNA_ID=CAMNT_0043468097 /DNA_START=239 /DNA_END=1858 /DNA_ORIENTATION=-
MVLNELGGQISSALRKMSDATVMDKTVIDSCLKEICAALLSADVNVRTVGELRKNVRNTIDADENASGINKRRTIERAVFKELVGMIDPGYPPFVLEKGKQNVIMFVGLQGAGKTTSVAKYALYYKRKGFKVAMVCADTYRAGAYDQLKQNATKVKVPYYGNYTETDPAKIAQEGVDLFKEQKMDLIIVDTSGRHKQEAALLEEMQQVAAAVEPDLSIFVMDSSIGQAAYDQASAFQACVDVGAVILTKMDGHAKGGGALSAVAATRSPIAFIGTGEHVDEFETFEGSSFVSRLLGMGDVKGLMGKLTDIMDEEQQEAMMNNIAEGKFPLRILYEQFHNVLQMGPMGQVMNMLPGMSQLMGEGRDQQSAANIKKYIALMDSMSQSELDNPDINGNLKMFNDESRVKRICRGAGRHYRDMGELHMQYKAMSTMISKMGSGLSKGAARGGTNLRAQNAQMAQMGKALQAANPAVMQQIGGMKGLQDMMKALESGEGGMGGLANMLGGLGGKGGLPGGMGGLAGLAGLGGGLGGGARKGRRK